MVEQVHVNAPKGDFKVVRKAAEAEFACNDEYDCGCVECEDYSAKSAEDSEGYLVGF